MTASGLLAFLLVPSFAAAAPSVPLPFDLTPQGAIIVPVNLNGTGPVPFLLDTGSNGSIVSAELASLLGARIVARTTMMSAAGQKDVTVAEIERLSIGDVTASGVLATIAPPGDLDVPDVVARGRKVQGVIGQDVLASLRYTIDYRAHLIVWRAAGDAVPRRASVFELEHRDDRFLVRLPQEHEMLRLVPDTGTEALVLFREDGRARSDVDVTLARDPVALTSLAGTRAARSATVRALRIGSTTLTDVAAVIVPREPASPAADGLLPLHIFARVTFNGPEHQLFIENR